MDGYEINYSITSWTPLTSGLPPCALDSAIVPSENAIHFMRVQGLITEPEVKGFTYKGPVGIAAGIGPDFSGFNQIGYAAGVCGPGSAGGYWNGSFSFPSTGSDPFDVTFWYASKKTPNAPDGIDLSTIAPQAYLTVFAISGSEIDECAAHDGSLLVKAQLGGKICTVSRKN